MSRLNKKGGPEAFSEFIYRFQKRVTTKPLSRDEFRINLEQNIPGLFNLLSSFSSAGIYPPAKSEWNPFSQRPAFLPFGLLDDQSILTRFDKSINAIDNFIETSHEVTHVLLWEPFFVGKCKNINRRHFVDASLIFEAYCFWYADMIVTRNLRVKLADGEFAKTRSAVSQLSFHPYRAFKAIGIEQPDQILDIYFQTFLGCESKLYQKRNEPFVADLVERFISFYLISLRPSQLLFDQLAKIKFFEEFRERFCHVAGMPSLLPDSILNMDFVTDPIAYCHAVYKIGQRHIENISEEKISRIRLRRFIQTRAYTAYSLLYALEAGLIFSRNHKVIRVKKVVAEITNYLDSLETMIKALCLGKSSEHIQRMCKRTDQYYSKKIRSSFKSNNAWMAQRHIFYPNLQTKTCAFGILEKKDSISRAEMLKLNKALIERFCTSKIKDMVGVKTKSAQKMSHHLSQLLNATSEVNKKWTKARIANWKMAYNRLLLDPEIIQIWSLPLSAIDPENNMFRELLFIYE